MYHLLRGLYEELTRRTEYSILVVGLNDSGKTTFVEHAKEIYTGKPRFNSGPTIGQNVVKIPVSNTILQFWDLGGSSSFTNLWDKYYTDAQAVLYFIDGTDRQRMRESWETFEKLKSHPELHGIPIIVCATKQDKEGAMNGYDVQKLFVEYSNNTPTTQYQSLSERLEAAEQIDSQEDDKRNLVLNLICTDQNSVKGLIDALFIRVQTSPRS